VNDATQRFGSYFDKNKGSFEGVLNLDGKPGGIGRVIRADNTIEEGVFSSDLITKVLFR